MISKIVYEKINFFIIVLYYPLLLLKKLRKDKGLNKQIFFSQIFFHYQYQLIIYSINRHSNFLGKNWIRDILNQNNQKKQERERQ